MKKIVLSALAVASLAGTAMAQDLTPVGTVQFRWVDRGLGVIPTAGGVASVQLPPSPANATLNNIANGTVTTDASFHLVLQAFVTDTVGGANPTRGFAAGSFNVQSNLDRALGGFAGNTALGSANPTSQPRNATVTNYVNGYPVSTSPPALPAGATNLPGQPAPSNGIFAPFRAVADIGGETNAQAIGVQNLAPGTTASMDGVVLGIAAAPFNQPADDSDPDNPVPAGPFHQQYQWSGLGQWVPLFAVVLNITNVAGLSQNVDVTLDINADVPGIDSGIRGWRGIQNGSALGDKWQLAIGQTGLPTFRIIIPAPGSAALLGLGGLIAARRRRA